MNSFQAPSLLRWLWKLIGPALFLLAPLFMFLLGMPTQGVAQRAASKAVEIEYGEIEYGYPDQSIFVATVNTKGQPDSPMTLVAEALMTKAGLSWHATPYPTKRLFENLKKGTTQFSILVGAPSLQDSCLFSRDPVYNTTLNVYHIGQKPLVSTKQELAGKHIITIRGYRYGGLLEFISDPAFHIRNEVAGTHRSAFKMLRYNRADYLLDYASAAVDILSQSPIPDLRATPLARLDIFLVLSKAYPDAAVLMEKLEKIAKTLDVEDILKKKRP